MSRLWVLGPSVSPAVADLLRDAGERVLVFGVHASARWAEVGPVEIGPVEPLPPTVYLVECAPPLPEGVMVHRIIGHYCESCLGFDGVASCTRCGGTGRDPSRPPALAYSVVGQVIAEVSRVGRLPESWLAGDALGLDLTRSVRASDGRTYVIPASLVSEAER